jgi:hypothetical protein
MTAPIPADLDLCLSTLGVNRCLRHPQFEAALRSELRAGQSTLLAAFRYTFRHVI